MTKRVPYAARSPRRGLLLITVVRGGRRTTNLRKTVMHSRASPKGANIGRCSYYTGGHSDGLLVYRILLFHPSINLPVYPSTSLSASDGRPLRGRRSPQTPQPTRKDSNDRLGLKPAEGRPDAHRSYYRPAGSAHYQKIGLTFSQLLRDAHPPHEDVGLCKGVAFSDRDSKMGFFNALPTRRWGYAKVSLSATRTAKVEVTPGADRHP